MPFAAAEWLKTDGSSGVIYGNYRGCNITVTPIPHPHKAVALDSVPYVILQAHIRIFYVPESLNYSYGENCFPYPFII